MPDMRKGKRADTGFDHDGVIGSIGRGVGSIVRDAGECGGRSLTAVVSSALATVAGVAHDAADYLNGNAAEGVTCVEVEYGARIRIPTADRTPGGINQIPCPIERSARCGRTCLATLGGNPGFPTDRLGSAYAVAKGETPTSQL